MTTDEACERIARWLRIDHSVRRHYPDQTNDYLIHLTEEHEADMAALDVLRDAALLGAAVRAMPPGSALLRMSAGVYRACPAHGNGHDDADPLAALLAAGVKP